MTSMIGKNPFYIFNSNRNSSFSINESLIRLNSINPILNMASPNAQLKDYAAPLYNNNNNNIDHEILESYLDSRYVRKHLIKRSSSPLQPNQNVGSGGHTGGTFNAYFKSLKATSSTAPGYSTTTLEQFVNSQSTKQNKTSPISYYNQPPKKQKTMVLESLEDTTLPEEEEDEYEEDFESFAHNSFANNSYNADINIIANNDTNIIVNNDTNTIANNVTKIDPCNKNYAPNIEQRKYLVEYVQKEVKAYMAKINNPDFTDEQKKILPDYLVNIDIYKEIDVRQYENIVRFVMTVYGILLHLKSFQNKKINMHELHFAMSWHFPERPLDVDRSKKFNLAVSIVYIKLLPYFINDMDFEAPVSKLTYLPDQLELNNYQKILEFGEKEMGIYFQKSYDRGLLNARTLDVNCHFKLQDHLQLLFASQIEI